MVAKTPGMFYQNDNYRPAYYTDSKSINENPTLTDGGSGTVSWYDADLTILTDLYLPYYLENIEITDEVYVATHAFFNVARAKEIKITFSTASWTKKFTMNKSIGNYAFARCIKLITAELPSTATTIGTGAFSQCYFLGKQDPDNNINGYVKLPNVLAEIPEACFNFCTNLAEITLPYKVSKIGKQAFFDCESLKKINSAYDESGSVNKQTSNTIALPETITIIGEEAFRYCQRFEIVVIPNNVQEIGRSALNGCKNLKDLTLPFIGRQKEILVRQILYLVLFLVILMIQVQMKQVQIQQFSKLIMAIQMKLQPISVMHFIFQKALLLCQF